MPTIAPSLNNSLDDKITEDELKQIEKEIESMAPTEEDEIAKPEEAQPQAPSKKPRSSGRGVADKPTRAGDSADKKPQQARGQRDKAPRFDKTNRRKGPGSTGEQKEARGDKAAPTRPRREQVRGKPGRAQLVRLLTPDCQL